MFHKCIFGKCHDDNYQYCIKCGKVRHIPCNHVWVEKERINKTLKYNEKITQIMLIIIDRCEKCGTINEHRISIEENE